MTELCAISIYMKDLKAGAKFYGDVLGFKVKKKLPYLVMMDGGGVDVVLCQAEEAAIVDYPSASAVVLGFPTYNIEERIEELKTKGTNLIHSTPQDFPAGKFIALRDPSGNVLELLEFRK